MRAEVKTKWKTFGNKFSNVDYERRNFINLLCDFVNLFFSFRIQGFTIPPEEAWVGISGEAYILP
jgi:hypothetical protein